MIHRHRYKGHTIDYDPDEKKTFVVVLCKVLKVISGLPEAISLCHAKNWINNRGKLAKLN